MAHQDDKRNHDTDQRDAREEETFREPDLDDDDLDITSIDLDDTGPIDVDPDLWSDTAPIPMMKDVNEHPTFRVQSSPGSPASADEEEPDTIVSPLDPAEFQDLDDTFDEPPPVIDDDDDEDDLNIDLDLDEDTAKNLAPPHGIKTDHAPAETPTKQPGASRGKDAVSDQGDDRQTQPAPAASKTKTTVKDTGKSKTTSAESKPTAPARTKEQAPTDANNAEKPAKKQASGESSHTATAAAKKQPVPKSQTDQTATGKSFGKAAEDPETPTLPAVQNELKKSRKKAQSHLDDALAALRKAAQPGAAQPGAAQPGAAQPGAAQPGTVPTDTGSSQKENATSSQLSKTASVDKQTSTTAATAAKSGNKESNNDQTPAVVPAPKTPAPKVVTDTPAPPSPPLLSVLDAMDRSLAASLRRDIGGTAERPLAMDLREQHLLFSMGNTHFAVPFPNVLEIGRSMPITPVPNVPSWILGVTNLRGDIMSVVDLSDFLGLGAHEQTHTSRMIVLRSRDDRVMAGCLVPRLEGSHVLPNKDIRTPTGQLAGRTADYLTGVFTRGRHMVAVLDADALLRSEAFQTLVR